MGSFQLLPFLDWRLPAKDRHENSVGSPQVSLHLEQQIFVRVEPQEIVKAFLIVPVAALYFSVMPRRLGTNRLVRNMQLPAQHIQRMHTTCFGGMVKLRSVVCLTFPAHSRSKQ